jgi:uncharacterized protein YecT (DUF1311 family)
MILNALLLAAAIDSADACAQFTQYRPPAAAVKALEACGDEGFCNIEVAEMFANGEGVKRNHEVAQYFLCQGRAEIAPAEFDGMWEHLAKMRSGEIADRLHFCDHVTSGAGQGRCASAFYDEAMPRFLARVEALRTKTKQPELFDALDAAARAFIEHETERLGEQSRGGTAYTALTLEAEIEATETYVDTLETWTKKRAPRASAAELQRADDRLNAAYRAELQAWTEDAELTESMGVDWKTIYRDTQRAWIAYRDAFTSYYIERWKGAAEEDVLRREIVAELTKIRAAELSE